MQIVLEAKGTEEIESYLSMLSQRMRHLAPIHREIGNMILNTVEESFDNEASPFGSAWIPSKKKSGKTLTDTGRLSSSFVVAADDEGVTVGTNVVYAAIHHFGGRAGRKKSAKIPARPFLPVDESGRLEQRLQEQIVAYLAEKIVAP